MLLAVSSYESDVSLVHKLTPAFEIESERDDSQRGTVCARMQDVKIPCVAPIPS